MPVHIYADEIELTAALADWIVHYIDVTLQKQDRFTIALSGGNTPKGLYSLLATDAYQQRIDWKRIHIFWGDERAVSFDDERNNAKEAYEVMLNKVPVVASQVHRMETISPEDAAKKYEELLHEYFDDQQVSFDLVLLGIGEDGHTLSVFPGSPILSDHTSWVKAVFVPSQKMWRISLTPLIVNKAAQIVFLVSGASKAEILPKILDGDSAYPSSIIHPNNGELHWFVDNPAAANIKNRTQTLY